MSDSMTSISLPSGKISEAMVEAGARQLCRLDGYDPDGKKLFGPKVKTWEAYAKTAEAVLTAALSIPAPGTGGAEDELAKLVEYFRGEGYGRFGWEGDIEGRSPAETAITAMRKLASTPPAGDLGAVKVKFGPVNCTHVLRDEGKPYPRTCQRCGLGPCPFYDKEGIAHP